MQLKKLYAAHDDTVPSLTIDGAHALPPPNEQVFEQQQIVWHNTDIDRAIGSAR